MAQRVHRVMKHTYDVKRVSDSPADEKMAGTTYGRRARAQTALRQVPRKNSLTQLRARSSPYSTGPGISDGCGEKFLVPITGCISKILLRPRKNREDIFLSCAA